MISRAKVGPFAPDIRQFAALMLAAAIAACGSPIFGGRLDARPHGANVAVPSRPSNSECATLIRSDHSTAAMVRATMGIDGIADTIGAAEHAASDPAADDSSYGIPLTPAEVELARAASRPPDATVGPAGLVAAHPEALNALWLDGGAAVISVLEPDPDILRLARCLEIGEQQNRIRYVSAGVAATELAALSDRIMSDRDVLSDEGIEITITGSDPATETVMVGVKTLNEDIKRRLVERYGTVLDVIETDGATPL